MKQKTYSVDKIDDVVKALSIAPPLPPLYVTQDAALKKLSKQIKDLHFKKNYDAHQIVKIIKENGLQITIKQVQDVLKQAAHKSPKKVVKVVKNVG
jgi:hypothetical protein